VNLTLRDGIFKFRIIFKKRKENHLKNKTGCLGFSNILDDIYCDVTAICRKSTK
jgi:hypothetical protein